MLTPRSQFNYSKPQTPGRYFADDNDAIKSPPNSIWNENRETATKNQRRANFRQTSPAYSSD